jgi:NTE family protein
MESPQFALVLGAGGARGLAHVGVLEVLEEAGLTPGFLVGTSMGGVVAALAAAGRSAGEIHEMARGFRFPRWYVPGRFVTWDQIFAPAARALAGLTFEELARPLAVVAVDLEAGRQIVLHQGDLLPALRASCAVPGVLPPVEIAGRFLVDGAVANALPIDVAAMAEPDIVVGVRVGGHGWRLVPSLRRPWHRLVERLGEVVPNPLSALAGFEVLARSAEIALDRQGTLASAMVEPHVLVDVRVGDVGLREFHRLDEVVAAGRRATAGALPSLTLGLRGARPRPGTRERLMLHLDPVCDMVVSPGRAAAISHDARTFYFCSVTCRDAFLRRHAGHSH